MVLLWAAWSLRDAQIRRRRQHGGRWGGAELIGANIIHTACGARIAEDVRIIGGPQRQPLVNRICRAGREGVIMVGLVRKRHAPRGDTGLNRHARRIGDVR